MKSADKDTVYDTYVSGLSVSVMLSFEWRRRRQSALWFDPFPNCHERYLISIGT